MMMDSSLHHATDKLYGDVAQLVADYRHAISPGQVAADILSHELGEAFTSLGRPPYDSGGEAVDMAVIVRAIVEQAVQEAVEEMKQVFRKEYGFDFAEPAATPDLGGFDAFKAAMKKLARYHEMLSIAQALTTTHNCDECPAFKDGRCPEEARDARKVAMLAVQDPTPENLSLFEQAVRKAGPSVTQAMIQRLRVPATEEAAGTAEAPAIKKKGAKSNAN
jgi:hypothetical protein